MKKILSIIYFGIVLNYVLNAQLNNNYFYNDNYKTAFGAESNYEINSNCITNHFLSDFMNGTYIDNAAKQNLFTKLNKNNRIGCEIEGKVYFSVNPDSLLGNDKTELFVMYNRFYNVNISFTEDLCKLFFNGNKQFAGKTANFDKSSFNILNYDQILLGIKTNFGHGDIQHTFGAAIGINNGYKNIGINFKKAELYTDSIGEYINLAANYEVSVSDTSYSKYNLFKGFGTSINLYYSFTTKKKNCFDFQITNFGFIHWNKNSHQLVKDTSFHFEGINVTDILHINENIFEKSNTDSIVNLYAYSDNTQPYYMLTPACLKISYLFNFSDKFRTYISLKKKFFTNYNPFAKLKIQYLPNENNIFSFNISCGGYGKTKISKIQDINLGMEYAHNFGKAWSLIIGSDFINSYMSYNSATAQGLFFSLKKYFF